MRPWSHYHDTLLEFPGFHGPLGVETDILSNAEHPSQPIIFDMRKPSNTEQIAELAKCVGDEGEFAVITAFNPGVMFSREQNLQLHVRLKTVLTERGIKFVQAAGVAAFTESGQLPHRELGVATRIHKDTAREIAELFKQDAFFWFDGQHFWIEPACVRDIAAARV